MSSRITNILGRLIQRIEIAHKSRIRLLKTCLKMCFYSGTRKKLTQCPVLCRGAPHSNSIGLPRIECHHLAVSFFSISDIVSFYISLCISGNIYSFPTYLYWCFPSSIWMLYHNMFLIILNVTSANSVSLNSTMICRDILARKSGRLLRHP